MNSVGIHPAMEIVTSFPVDGVLVANIHPTQIGSPGSIMGNVGRGLRPL
jgi:hypothetical protein